MAEQCRLCRDLPQPTTHFDRDYWKMVKKAAELRAAEVRAEISEADRHLRMLATPPPPVPLG
jgi:hypothetical protein